MRIGKLLFAAFFIHLFLQAEYSFCQSAGDPGNFLHDHLPVSLIDSLDVAHLFINQEVLNENRDTTGKAYDIQYEFSFDTLGQVVHSAVWRNGFVPDPVSYSSWQCDMRYDRSGRRIATLDYITEPKRRVMKRSKMRYDAHGNMILYKASELNAKGRMKSAVKIKKEYTAHNVLLTEHRIYSRSARKEGFVNQHYSWNFDNAEKLISMIHCAVSHCDTTVYGYNTYGDISKENFSGAMGHYVRELVHSRTSNSLNKIYHFADTASKRNFSGFQDTLYMFNPGIGQLLTMKVSKDNLLSEMFTFTYDMDGNIASRTQYLLSADDWVFEREWRFVYYPNGLIAKAEYTNDRLPYDKTAVTFFYYAFYPDEQ